jgi:Flp pilus assembly protein TadB
MIQNESYKGLADFEDRSTSYVAFVRALIPRIASMNPRCVFKSGTSNLNWWAQAIFLLGIISLLLLVMIMLYTAISPLVIVKLIIIAFFVPVAIRWFLRNKPKTFPIDEIPRKLLPKP